MTTQGSGPNRFLDDMSRLMTNAMGVAQGARDEAETAMKSWVDRWLADRNFVTREEFEAVRDMAIKARTENAELRAMIAELQGKDSGDQPGGRALPPCAGPAAPSQGVIEPERNPQPGAPGDFFLVQIPIRRRCRAGPDGRSAAAQESGVTDCRSRPPRSNSRMLPLPVTTTVQSRAKVTAAAVSPFGRVIASGSSGSDGDSRSHRVAATTAMPSIITSASAVTNRRSQASSGTFPAPLSALSCAAMPDLVLTLAADLPPTEPLRLDKALAEAAPASASQSRSRIVRLIAEGAVRGPAGIVRDGKARALPGD